MGSSVKELQPGADWGDRWGQSWAGREGTQGTARRYLPEELAHYM